MASVQLAPQPSSTDTARNAAAWPGILVLRWSSAHHSSTSYGMELLQLVYTPTSQPLVRNRSFSAFLRTLLNLTSSLNSGVIRKQTLPVLLHLLPPADSSEQPPAEESHHTPGTGNQAMPGINTTPPLTWAAFAPPLLETGRCSFSFMFAAC